MERMSYQDVVVGAVCWILTVEYFVGQVVAQAAWKTPYSLLDNPVSDLGNTACGQWPQAAARTQLAERLGAGGGFVCSPLHSLMNVSFVAAGILLVLGLGLTRRVWPKRQLATWGFVLLALAGMGKIVVGLAPENSSLLLHELGGLGIPLSCFGVLLMGLAVWQSRRRLAVFSVSLASVGLLGLLGWIVSVFIRHGHGAAERIAAYPVFVWMLVLGISFLLAARSGIHPRSTLAA